MAGSVIPKKESLWKFGGVTPLKLIKETWAEIGRADLFGRSAELAYYFLFALFPAMLFLVTILGFIAKPGSTLHHTLFDSMARMMPASASQLIAKTLSEIHQAAGGGKLIFGLAAALWSASGGVVAIITTLNLVYRVQETRSWVRQKVTAVALTFALATTVLIALALVVGGERIAQLIAAHMALGNTFVIGWEIAQWPVVLGFMLAAFALIYYFAPNIDGPEWYWVSPGAVVGLTLWLVASFGMRVYLHYFNSYSATYGSLGAVMILMTWFYLTGAAILAGGALNSTIGHIAEQREERHRKLVTLGLPEAA